MFLKTQRQVLNYGIELGKMNEASFICPQSPVGVKNQIHSEVLLKEDPLGARWIFLPPGKCYGFSFRNNTGDTEFVGLDIDLV